MLERVWDLDIPIEREKLKDIWRNDGEIYLVGGAVRDLVMDKEINDLDLVVIGLSQEVFENIFYDAKKVGSSFEIYLYNECEISLGRVDKEGNRPKIIEEDLYRRDFKMNSMAINLRRKDELIDPYGGQKNIKNRTVDYTSKVNFKNDVLRVYRGLRQAVELNFNISLRTQSIMSELKKELSGVLEERVFEELKKVLKSENPSRFFKLLKYAKLLDVHFKELADLIDVPQVEKYHPEICSFEHTLMTLDRCVDVNEEIVVRFACLVHDLGKGRTEEDVLPHHYKHSKNGIKPLNDLCDRLGLPNKWREAGQFAIKHHMRLKKWKEMSCGKLARLYEQTDRNTLNIRGLAVVGHCDHYGRKLDFSKEGFMDFHKFLDLGCRMLRRVNGQTIDFRGKEGRARGNLLFNERSHWIKRERNRILEGGE